MLSDAKGFNLNRFFGGGVYMDLYCNNNMKWFKGWK